MLESLKWAWNTAISHGCLKYWIWERCYQPARALNLSLWVVVKELLSDHHHIIRTVLMSTWLSRSHSAAERVARAPDVWAQYSLWNLKGKFKKKRKKSWGCFTQLWNHQLIDNAPAQDGEGFTNISIKMLWERHSLLSYPMGANV